MTIPYNSSLSPTTALTVEAWVKIAASGNKEIVGQTNQTNPTPVSYNLAQNGQKITFSLCKSAIPYSWTTNTNLTLNTWHYVVATWDGTTAKIYVDGILDMTPGTLASPIDSSSSYPVMIGDYGNASAVFNGYIDEVKIYNRALTGPATNCVANTSSEVCQRYGISGNPKIRGDYADIRFTDSTGTINYSYWQENDNKFWVKIPSLVNGNTTVYMLVDTALIWVSSM